MVERGRSLPVTGQGAAPFYWVETVSMRDEFETIYKPDAVKTEPALAQAA